MPTIRKLPSGHFQVKPNDSDRRKGVGKETFDTQAEAQARLAQIHRQLGEARLPTGLPSRMPSGMPPWIANPTVSGSTTRGQYSVSCLWCGDALTTCHDKLADHFLAFHRTNHAAQDGDK